MSDFQPLPIHRLERLADRELIDYVGAARRAGDSAAERSAIGYLAFAFEPTIKAWVRRRTPAADVDDVVMEVFESVIDASFHGKVLGEFGSFLRTICERRVADNLRRRGRRLDADPMPSEHEGDEAVWGTGPSVGDETGRIALRDALERVLATRNPLHQQVIRLYGSGVDGFEDLSAGAVSARIEAAGTGERVTVDNVAKIWSRFIGDVRRELDG